MPGSDPATTRRWRRLVFAFYRCVDQASSPRREPVHSGGFSTPSEAPCNTLSATGPLTPSSYEQLDNGWRWREICPSGSWMVGVVRDRLNDGPRLQSISGLLEVPLVIFWIPAWLRRRPLWPSNTKMVWLLYLNFRQALPDLPKIRGSKVGMRAVFGPGRRWLSRWHWLGPGPHGYLPGPFRVPCSFTRLPGRWT